MPVPSVNSEYQRTADNQWSGNARTMRLVGDGKYGSSMLYAEFAETETKPVVELMSRFQTQNRSTDWSRKSPMNEDPATLKFWTASTELMPTDGIVRQTALDATKGTEAKAVWDRFHAAWKNADVTLTAAVF